MLKLLFHRFSLIPKLVEGLGLSGALFLIYNVAIGKTALPFVLGIVFLLYFFLRACAFKRWYKGMPRDSGIELHFRKILAPTAYLLTFSVGAYLFFQQTWVAVVTIPIFLFLAVVNGILIYLHLQDKTGAPINSLTRPS